MITHSRIYSCINLLSEIGLELMRSVLKSLEDSDSGLYTC